MIEWELEDDAQGRRDRRRYIGLEAAAVLTRLGQRVTCSKRRTGCCHASRTSRYPAYTRPSIALIGVGGPHRYRRRRDRGPGRQSGGGAPRRRRAAAPPILSSSASAIGAAVGPLIAAGAAGIGPTVSPSTRIAGRASRTSMRSATAPHMRICMPAARESGSNRFRMPRPGDGRRQGDHRAGRTLWRSALVLVEPV
jgi:hypothetical protein